MEQISNHLAGYDLSILRTQDARFMDQKVTPDVLCIVSDCILQFIKENSNREFTARDIWESDYANENIKDIFNKPDVLNKNASSEYDKFFAQPLRMLAYAHVLRLERRSNKNIFTVHNKKLLEYIAIKERNALNFIVLYLEKVLADSWIFYLFEDFFNRNTKDAFDILKSKYKDFIIKNTSINGRTEVRRIFTKIINPLSYVRKLYGTKWGYLSQDIIGYDELMYNRKNWRDISKLKGETRQEYESRARVLTERRKNAFVKFSMEKAKRLIKERYGERSQVNDELSNGVATQVHHIFPKNEYPEIATYLENLILLTPTQHATKAHPNNNTRLIDKNYQYLCLLSKSDSIKKSIDIDRDWFYSKEDFIFVLNDGIKPDVQFTVGQTFDEINQKITFEYHEDRN